MNKVTPANGLDIPTTAARLRIYATVQKRCLKILSGWFLVAPRYEDKYKIGYHLFEHSEHVTMWRQRLIELRGGKPDASISPALSQLLNEVNDAPDADSMMSALYGIVIRSLHDSLKHHLNEADLSANAAEVRLIRRILPELKSQLDWFNERPSGEVDKEWLSEIQNFLDKQSGGLLCESESGDRLKLPSSRPFRRPATITFDERIVHEELMPYEKREQLDYDESLIEQFRIFFNEFYAAGFLATILYDALDEGGYSWEMIAEFSQHFWDEVRHSEFGAIRLKELGAEPTGCNLTLFHEAENMPILHRIVYLTRGLEAYFMPRKQPRAKTYEKAGDLRSQLFADQDWSDEINHVRYGSRWSEHLLEDDYRAQDDVIEEIKQHLTKVRGVECVAIAAPF